MAWPSWQDFNDAVQDPRSCFADPELWGDVTTDAMGLPRVYSGNFAVVYQFHAPDKSRQWAVKCFTKPVADRQQRYRAISEHLRRADLPFSVAFTYQEQGIRLRGTWYPIVKMDWIEGLTLTQFVRANLDRPGVLDVLSQIWLKLAQRLRQAAVTHGDLQHGNVLLVPGSSENKLALKLVDYDGLWVPALAGQPSGELGLRDYQHPQRGRDKFYGPEMDRFGHLVIFTALRALRFLGPGLWKTYDTGENLLFSARDYAAPADSKLLRELWQGSIGDLRHLAGRLILAAHGPLHATPELNAVADEESVRLLSIHERGEVEKLLKKTDVKLPAAQTIVAPPATVAPVAGPVAAPAAPPASVASPWHAAFTTRAALWSLTGGGALVLILAVGLASSWTSVPHEPQVAVIPIPEPAQPAPAPEPSAPASQAPQPLGPRVEISLPSSELVLVAGDKKTLPIKLERHAYRAAITFEVQGLPEGVTVRPGTIPDGDWTSITTTLELVSEVNAAPMKTTLILVAKPANLAPLEREFILVVKEARAAAAVPSPRLFMPRTQVVLLPGETKTLAVMLEKDGARDPITFEVLGLPQGITAKTLAPVGSAGDSITTEIELAAHKFVTAQRVTPRIIARPAMLKPVEQAFTIVVREAPPVVVAAPIVLAIAGGMHSGTYALTANDTLDPVRRQPAKQFLVDLVGGRLYRIEGQATTFEARLRVEDQAGTILVESTSTPAQVLVTPKFTGRHRISATSQTGALGEFTLTLNEREVRRWSGTGDLYFATPAAPLTLTKQDTLWTRPTGAQHYYKEIPLELQAGFTYVFDANGRDSNPHLRLLALQGFVEGWSTDFITKKASQLTFHCRLSGTYLLQATTYTPQKLGTFTLRGVKQVQGKITPPVLTPLKISVANRFTANVLLSNPRAHDAYEVFTRGPGTFAVEVKSARFAPQVRVFADANLKTPVREAIGKGGFCQIDNHVSTMDRVYLTVSSNDERVGEFELVVRGERKK